MSVSSDVHVEIDGYREKDAILPVMAEHFEVTGHNVQGRTLDVEGYAGVSDPQRFADSLAHAIWKANGPCDIEIGVRPCHWESFTYDEGDCEVDGDDDEDESEDDEC